MLRDISLHILDLVQNSVKAKADRIDIELSADTKADLLRVVIKDNGCGMSKEFLKRVEDPFTTGRTTRNVGMGIPFFKLACILTGGDFHIESEEGEGTVLEGALVIDSIDRLPLGDLGETVKFLIMGSPEIRFVVTIRADENEDVFDTDEVKTQLEDVPIDQPDILEWINSYINDDVANIFGGVLNEVIGRA